MSPALSATALASSFKTQAPASQGVVLCKGKWAKLQIIKVSIQYVINLKDAFDNYA